MQEAQFNNADWQLSICPTDTLWGMVAKFSQANQEKIYQLKERDRDKPLILFAQSIDTIKNYVDEWNDEIDELAIKHWPGALTLVLKRGKNLPAWLNPGFDFIGFRIPVFGFEQPDLFAGQEFLLSTSANLSGEPAVETYEQASEQFSNKVDLIIKPKADFQFSNLGSTVVKIEGSDINVLRQGEIKIESLKN